MLAALEVGVMRVMRRNTKAAVTVLSATTATTQPHYNPAIAFIYFNIHIYKKKKKPTFDTPRSREKPTAIYTAIMVLPESKNKVGLGRALMNSNRNARRSVGSGGKGRGRGSSGAGEVVWGQRSCLASSVSWLTARVRADVDGET